MQRRSFLAALALLVVPALPLGEKVVRNQHLLVIDGRLFDGWTFENCRIEGGRFTDCTFRNSQVSNPVDARRCLVSYA